MLGWGGGGVFCISSTVGKDKFCDSSDCSERHIASRVSQFNFEKIKVTRPKISNTHRSG